MLWFKKYGLNERQGKTIEFLLTHGKITIRDFEVLCPEVNRRSLQQDLKVFNSPLHSGKRMSLTLKEHDI